jgi:hypothetical protein
MAYGTIRRFVHLIMNSIRAMFAAPAACTALLIGMFGESQTRLSPTDAGPTRYHAEAKEAIDSFPTVIGSWSATPESVPPEAIKLLRPNDIRCLRYVDDNLSAPQWYDRWAILLVDQCKDARDMDGHYPPNCYVNSGEEQTFAQDRDWKVGDLVITGEEYHFLKSSATESSRQAVYNFLIVPKSGIVRDMDGVRKAAGDYEQRYYGAAQFQLVMNADLPQQQRDEIFTTLMEPCVPAIRTLLMSGGSQ